MLSRAGLELRSIWQQFQTNLSEASDEEWLERLNQAHKTKSLDPFRYRGPAKHWVHMIHVDNEEDEFPGHRTLDLKSPISVSSPHKVFPEDHAGRRFLRSSPTGVGFVRLGDGSLHRVESKKL